MTTAPTGYDDTSRGMGLSGVLEIARRRRVLALLPFLFVLTAAASLAFFLPSLWTARALVLVNRQEIPETFVKSTVATDLEARLMTLSQELLSRDRLQKIIQDHDLYRDLRGRASADEIVEKMRKDIRLEVAGDERDRRPRDARTLAFTVAYTAADPQVAATVANTLAALYTEENTRQRGQQAAGASQFFEAQLADVQAKLAAQEKRVADFKERYLGELPEQREANLRTLDRLQQQLQLAHENNRRAHERRQLLSQTLAEIDQSTGLTAAGAGPSVRPGDTLAARLNLLRQELAEMQTRYSEKYPDLVALKEQVRALEAKMAADQAAALAQQTPGKPPGRVAPTNSYVQSLMTQIDQANVELKAGAAEIANLKAQIATYQKRVDNMPRREQELAQITREYEATRELYRSLLTKLGEAGIAADLESRQKGEHFRLIEPAALPERPAGPNRMRLLLVGLALALGASGLAVVLAEQVDTSYRRVEDVRASVPAPVLSAIPRITTEADRRRSRRQQRLATAAVAAALLAVVGSSFALAHGNQALVGLLMPAETPAGRR